MNRVLAVLVMLASLVTPCARAEIAVLSNGTTFKISSYRVEGENVMLALQEGGEVGAPAALVMGFVPDEVLDEIATAVAETVQEGGSGGDVRGLAVAAARRHGLDPDLVLAVVAVESAFRPDAVSPKGAQGLMQLMPRTAASLGVSDALDPAQNLDAGTRHLRFLVDLYGGDLRRALAAYNAGQGAVKRYGGVPPYRETREYVKKILKRYEADKR